MIRFAVEQIKADIFAFTFVCSHLALLFFPTKDFNKVLYILFINFVYEYVWGGTCHNMPVWVIRQYFGVVLSFYSRS